MHDHMRGITRDQMNADPEHPEVGAGRVTDHDCIVHYLDLKKAEDPEQGSIAGSYFFPLKIRTCAL